MGGGSPAAVRSPLLLARSGRFGPHSSWFLHPTGLAVVASLPPVLVLSGVGVADRTGENPRSAGPARRRRRPRAPSSSMEALLWSILFTPVPYPGRKSKIRSDWAAAARCASCPPWRHRLGLVGVGFEVLMVGALVGVGCERHQLRLDSTVLVCPRILVGWCSSTAACAARFRRCGAFDPAVGNCGSLPGCSGMLAALGHLVVFSYAAGGHGSSTTCLFASLSLLFPPRRLLPVAFLLHLAGQGLRRCGRCAVLPMPRWSCTTADLGFETGSPSALGEHLPLSTVGAFRAKARGLWPSSALWRVVMVSSCPTMQLCS